MVRAELLRHDDELLKTAFPIFSPPATTGSTRNENLTMASIPTLHALLIDEIKDLFYAEHLLLKALPKMAQAATNPDLKAGFTGHLAETRGHVARLTQALKILSLPAKGKICHAMLGLVEEGAEAITMKGPAAVRDAALIGAAQRVEHYEMAGYGTARAFAQALGETDVADLLQATLDEEGETTWHGRPLVTSRPHDAVRRTDGVVDVGKQRKRELLSVGEPLVRGGRVEGGSEHDGTQFGK